MIKLLRKSYEKYVFQGSGKLEFLELFDLNVKRKKKNFTAELNITRKRVIFRISTFALDLLQFSFFASFEH